MTGRFSMQAFFDKYGIVALCFGYFLGYIPYAMLTKMLTSGLLPGMDGHGYSGFIIQPVIVTATVITMYVYLWLSGWYKYATQWQLGRWSLPRPRACTLLAGICTSGIIITTTLAYTFEGVSIVFAMLLMRGGLLMMAPLVDLLSVKRRRKIYWPSWIAAGLSLAALLVSFSSKSGTAMTVIATVDIVLYLTSYFLRLNMMSAWAKSHDIDEMKRFFAEDQMTANTVLLLGTFVFAFIGAGMDPASIPGQLWRGVVEFPFLGYNWICIAIGVTSFSGGLFGSLIFLDRRENTFTVPANRVSSVLSGVIATYLMAIFYGGRYPGADEMLGVGLIITAIVFLTIHSIVEKRRAALSVVSGHRAA